MHNIIFLTNKTIYPNHNTFIELFAESNNITPAIIDVSEYKYPHECISAIQKENPNIIITLDLSGFSFKTQSGQMTLNILNAKIMNIIINYSQDICEQCLRDKKVSLSMIFYNLVNNIEFNKYSSYIRYSYNFPIVSDNINDIESAALADIWKHFLLEIS